MWLNERRRGPGGSASSRRQAARLPPSPPAPVGGRRAPHARRLRKKCLSWGLLRAPAVGRQLADSWLGTRAPRFPFPAGAARISCRGSRAPGAAPSDRTTRARVRGRPLPRGFDVCGGPSGSPRRATTLVAPGLREGASRLRRSSRAPLQLRQRRELGGSIFGVTLDQYTMKI
ncbi:uncharacterized protein WM277_021728 [Molossus nigricans]